MNIVKYQEIDFEEIQYLLDESLILLITATNLETKHTHLALSPIVKFDGILQVYEKNLTYYFGMFGMYKVAHVQCEMGSIGRGSSITTLTSALEKLKVKVVIMVGIAFGIDDNKQNIGDVLISESIIPYDSKRIGIESNIQRGKEATASELLLNRFKNIKNWNHVTSHGKTSELIFTRILSGEELIDNYDHRNKLLEQYPDSKGGEMEGAGVYAACGNKTDWILVKGICDFANGEKGKNKNENQEIAIKSALSVCLMLFNSPRAFKDLNVSPYNQIPSPELLDFTKINDVLFNYYNLENEPYYVLRDFDESFNLALTQYGIWVFGPSGCGKTNLIIRNLRQTNKEFILVDLAPFIGDGVECLFKELLHEVCSYINGVDYHTQSTELTEIIKELVDLLKFYKDKELVIFIEEIPISSGEEYRKFTQKLFSIIISNSFLNGLNNIKFVLSSIENPTPNIIQNQQKIHQHVQFVKLEYWLENDIEKLLEIIVTEFQIPLKHSFREDLINSAKGSPRFVKKFFKTLFTINKFDDNTLKRVLIETQRDLN
ncbi:hypothetical protein [Cellulophaga sp. BC115SP]|uniref:phosphorylase family protein n=1 Tax=Cellulophaga sp. BC115SP TaxID=2683263 RepID=UPI0014121175|nr:hypothetical protein [Cellulophaga sp. BC115SP]NBB31826.1 hypothetical protein [Cellulophaga sp. BC115SP]